MYKNFLSSTPSGSLLSLSSVDTAEPSPVPKVVEFFSNQAIVDAPIIPVRPCSNQASVEHYCEISRRALVKGRLSLVLVGTVSFAPVSVVA